MKTSIRRSLAGVFFRPAVTLFLAEFCFGLLIAALGLSLAAASAIAATAAAPAPENAPQTRTTSGQTSAAAPAASLEALVTDEYGSPRPDAVCVLYDGAYMHLGDSFHRTTDGEGAARWSKLDPGSYYIEIYHAEGVDGLWATGSFEITDGNHVFTFERLASDAAPTLPETMTPAGSLEFPYASGMEWETIDWAWHAGISSGNVAVESGDLKLLVEDNTGVGAQLNSTSGNFGPGIYRATIKACEPTESPQGVTNGFFHYWGESDTVMQEIDVEINSDNPDSVNLVLHRNGRTIWWVRARVPDPVQDFHTYEIDWTTSSLTFRVDGAVPLARDLLGGGTLTEAVVLREDHPEDFPTHTGRVMLNNWTGPTSGWRLEIPTGIGHDLEMLVRDISYAPATSTGLFARVETPKLIELAQNAPNPFNPMTKIEFTMSEDSHVRMTIHDVSGRPIRQLLDESTPKGRHHIYWDGRNDSGYEMASGVYFYRMEAGGREETRQMVLLH